MELRTRRIIIADTNWWVSLILKKFENKFASIITHPNLKFISSEELVREIQPTLSKARLQKYFDNTILEEFWLLFNSLVVAIKISSSVSICRDAADNYLLALSKDSDADYLITGDKDLLELKQFGKTRIVTLTEFVNLLNNNL